ncbi:MAG: hypothetical protein ABW224_01000 [Kibdelosporangium sp.]
MTNDMFLKERTEKRADKAAGQAGWLDGESLEMVRLYSGHFLGLIAGKPAAPHVPGGDLPECGAKAPKWPLPTDLVSGNEFLGDEWVYDPAIHGRIIATDLDRDAVRCANHLIAGHTKAFLALTDRRLAVVIEQGDIAGESGVGKLLGRFGKDKPEEEADEKLVTWWQIARPDVGKVAYGRHYAQRRWFSTFHFPDGSVLEIRHPG